MYPYYRTVKVLTRAYFSKKQTLSDKTIIHFRVNLFDIDLYPELNNGRHLTLMDLGRYDFGLKVGLFNVLKEQNWGLMVAGNFTRYRRRITLFQKFELHTELVGYDEKWYYFYQQTVKNGITHSSALIRTAVTSKSGIVPAAKVAEAMKIDFKPSVPDWVKDWIRLNEVSPTLN